MASSISISPRGSRSSSPRPPPHYKFTILAPDVYAPKSIVYNPSEDKSYGFCKFLMGKFESHFGMRCTMPTLAGAAFFGDFNEFEERFLVDAEYIVIVITSMSLKVFKKFYPRLLVFVTVRPEWMNRFIFVMVGDIMLEPSVDLTVFFHEPIFFKESGWEADIETWKNLHVLLKVEWSPIKDKTGSPRCGEVVSIIQRTVVETEVQEVRTRRRTDSRRSEGGSTPGNLSPPRPARPVSTTSTPSSPVPGRIGSYLSKSTDSHLHVVPPTREKARTEFNEAGEAITSNAKPSEEKRRSPFLGRRSFGGRAKILVEQDLPKPKVKIERAPDIRKEEEERRKRRSTGSEDQVFADSSSKLESYPDRKKRASPERRKEKKKFTELLVGTENLDTEVCIVENIAIDCADNKPQGETERGEEKREKMEVDEKLAGAKRAAEEKTEEEGKRRKPNEKVESEEKRKEKGASSSIQKMERKKSPSREEKKKEKRGSSAEKEKKKSPLEEKRKEKERKDPTEEEQARLASNRKNAKWGEDMEEDPRMKHLDPGEKVKNKEGEQRKKMEQEAKKKNPTEEKEDKHQDRSKEMADREKLIAMETGESQTFVTMTAKTGTSSKEAGATASQWDYTLTSDYSSLNSSTSSSRTLSSVQSPPPPFESIVKSINIEDQGSAVPSQPCAADAVKKSEITDRVVKSDNQQEDAPAASGDKEESSEIKPKVTERAADLASSWRRALLEAAQDPLHRPVPVFLLLATATALSPFYHRLSCAAFNSLAALLCSAAPLPIPSTVAILPAAAVAALPEVASAPPPAPVSSMMVFVSPFLLPFSSSSSSGVIPQNLYFFRVSRGP